MGTDNVDDASDLSDRTVLVLGRIDRAEMQKLAEWLKIHIGCAPKWMTADCIDTAIHSSAAFPDLIVVFQSGPDEFSKEEVNRLLAYAPLARLVVCYGAWCESDGRNHSIWPPAARVPVWAARGRIAREWRSIQSPGNERPLPWSASREEVFAADHPLMTDSLAPQQILVDSPDPAYRAFLIEQLCAAGHCVQTVNPTVLIFDCDPWGPIRDASLQSLMKSYPRSRVMALANLVQPALTAELNRYQVQLVLPKLGPSLLEILSENPLSYVA